MSLSRQLLLIFRSSSTHSTCLSTLKVPTNGRKQPQGKLTGLLIPMSSSQEPKLNQILKNFFETIYLPKDGLSHVEYRPDAGPEDTLCYRYYNATERIHGRTMEDWLRPAVSFWHAFHCSSTDYTQGHQSPHRSWDDGTNSMENCKRRLKAAFEFYTKIGCKYWTLYDRDVSPEGDTFEDTNHHLDEVSDLIMELQQRTGIKPLWVASNLHSHPRYIHGATTSPEVQVIAQAGAQMKKALELAHKLGAECFLFQSTQEGYCSVLNTDMSRELRNYSRHLKMLQEFKERITFRGQLLIQPSFDNDHNEGNSYKTYYKRDEIPKYHYNWDPTSTLTFLKHYNLDRYYKLSVSPGHQLFLTSTYGMLGSVDITSSTTRPNIREATLLMKTIIEQGGIQPGGLNFGLPLRRESVDLKDLMVAYISYIDIYARGLRNAAKIIADGVFAKNLQQQYLSYHTGFGSRFTSGEANLEDCEEQAQKHQGEITPSSVHTEHWEAVFSRYI